jgi:hypothetical protein
MRFYRLAALMLYLISGKAHAGFTWYAAYLSAQAAPLQPLNLFLLK